jgi:hypothetical protein
MKSTGEEEGVDLVPGLRDCIGNIINGVVFGRTYAADDPTWIWLQHLLDEGVKQVAVAGPINFLPVLRLPLCPISIFSSSFFFCLLLFGFFCVYIGEGFCRDIVTSCRSSLTANRKLTAITKR